jgi:ABC-type sugar transport system ATPase subunit
MVKNPGTAPECHFQGIVDVVEPMGAETHIYVKTGEAHTIVCRSEAQIDHSLQGACLEFQINIGKVHLFDPETTERIPKRS